MNFSVLRSGVSHSSSIFGFALYTENIISKLHNVELGPGNPTSCDLNPHQLAKLINEAFLAPMKDFNPLLQNNQQLNADRDAPVFQVSEFQIFKSLLTLNSTQIF